MKKHTFIFILWQILHFAYAEGTKQLRPQEADFGNLFLSTSPSFTDFGQYGAPEEQQIKIRVASPDETIYFGFNNHFQGGDFVEGLPFRIVSPSGVVVYESATVEFGEGYIDTYDEVAAGPQELGNAAGYDAIAIDPDEIGDYVLEFDMSAVNYSEIHFQLFDVTVADATNQAVPGRLHSRGWQLSTGGGSNPFAAKVYPYDDNGIVYEVDFNDMQPYSFVINFNSQGTGNTGDFLVDRQSKTGNHTFPEYEVFLNPPDENLYPTVDKTVSFSGEVRRTDCMRAEFCLSYTSNTEGYLEGFVDLNGNNIYDEGTDIHFYDFFESGNTKCIDWDGTDASGNAVDEKEIKIFSSFGFGVTHLPLYDVEHNRNGYKVRVVSPANLPAPLIFWDDSNINAGDALDGLENLTGCNSTGTGCHRWEDRGNNSNPETINSWWYTRVMYDTLVIESLQENPVNLSFHPDALNKEDTVICKADSLSFYVYNDGKTHFDTTAYTYEWFFNSQAVQGDIREQKLSIPGPSEMVVKATDLKNASCVTYDTLHVDVVEPVTLTAIIENENCGLADGSITVSLLSSPPDPQYSWVEFPSEQGNQILNLSAGTYNLHVEDPAYSSSCALDTTFEIISSPPVHIEELSLTHTLCYEAGGAAEVTVVNPTGTYEYSWNGEAYIDQPSSGGLAAGSYTVAVKDPVTLCEDDTTFTINPLPFDITATLEPEVCSNSQGSIQLQVPAADFDIIWNGSSTGSTELTGISSGSYSLSVISQFESSCRVDSVFEITQAEQPVVLDTLMLRHIICGNPGSAEVLMPQDGRNYIFSWNSGPYLTTRSLPVADPGLYTLSVKEDGSTCQMDTSFTIAATFPPEIESVMTDPSECYEASGSASVTMADPAGQYQYSWNEQAYTPSPQLSPLGAGNFSVTVRDLNTGCTDDTTFTIPSLPLQISISTGPELCSNAEGYIDIQAPEGDFFFYLDGNASPDNIMDNLNAGNYGISVVARNNTSCRVDTIAVVPEEERNVVIEDLLLNEVICGEATGSAEIVMPADGETYSFAWNNGAFGSTKEITGLSRGSYSVSVLLDGTSCRLDTTFNITGSDPIRIESLPVTDIMCYESSGEASVAMADPFQPYEYSWDAQAFIEQNSIAGLAAGQHSLLVKNPQTGCTTDTLFNIAEGPFSISFTSLDEYCSRGQGSVTIEIPQGDFTVLWNGNTETSNPVTGLSQGNYTLSVIANNNSACRVDTVVPVLNHDNNITADFTYLSTAYQQKMETGAVIKFTNTSTGAGFSSAWEMGDGTLTSEKDPDHSYSAEGEYTVTLTVEDSLGCTSTIAKVLKISQHVPCGIALPNAFSPNDDQNNDNIGVLGYAESVDLKIFNRWGEVVFRAQKTEERWDGTYRSSESPVGVYPYTIDYECPDEKQGLIRKQSVGTITLIR